MRRGAALAVVVCVMGAGFDRAIGAEVVVSINKAAQTMSVLIDGAEAYNWVVSTGIGGGPHDGTYRPGRMERKWASRKYNMAPMPYSIFFDGNYAIHGTVKVSQLGRRASKGCVRLHPRDAAVLFELVGREKANTTIVVDKATHVAARVPAAAPAEPSKPETTGSVSTRPDAAVPALIQAEPASPARPRKVRSNTRRSASARGEPQYRVYYHHPWFWR